MGWAPQENRSLGVLPRSSLWPEWERSWSEVENTRTYQNEFPTCNLIMVTTDTLVTEWPQQRVTRTEAPSAGCCQPGQRNLGSAQWASFNWYWHLSPFPGATLCRASLVKATFVLALWLTWASISFSDFSRGNMGPLDNELVLIFLHWPRALDKEENIKIVWTIEPTSEGSDHLGPSRTEIWDHPAQLNVKNAEKGETQTT